MPIRMRVWVEGRPAGQLEIASEEHLIVYPLAGGPAHVKLDGRADARIA